MPRALQPELLPQSISVQDLVLLVGGPFCPRLVDARRAAVFDEAPDMAAGALRVDPASAANGPWPESWRDGVVIYCAHGHGVSQGFAARLRAAGIPAAWLEGGLAAWRAAGGPLRRRLPDYRPTEPGGSLWVTRRRPKIDRIACPWLIRRFIDPEALILYVDPAQVAGVAKETGAVAFDTEDAPITHRGPLCSFDDLIDIFGLDAPALPRLAEIVRGADTARFDLAPQAAGLLAVSLGLSRLWTDDHAMLAQGIAVYDALYAWCRDAYEETHTWTGATAGARVPA